MMTGTSCEGAMCSALETRNSRKRVPHGFDVTRLKLRTVHICGNQLHEESGDFKAWQGRMRKEPINRKVFWTLTPSLKTQNRREATGTMTQGKAKTLLEPIQQLQKE